MYILKETLGKILDAQPIFESLMKKIIKMEIDGKIIDNISNNFTFKNPGVHNVSVKLESAEVISLLFNNSSSDKKRTNNY